EDVGVYEDLDRCHVRISPRNAASDRLRERRRSMRTYSTLSLTSVCPYGLNFSRTSSSSKVTGQTPRRLAARTTNSLRPESNDRVHFSRSRLRAVLAMVTYGNYTYHHEDGQDSPDEDGARDPSDPEVRAGTRVRNGGR